MPSAKAITWLGALIIMAACAGMPPPDPMVLLMPSEIRRGFVESAIAPVEQDVSREEIEQTIGSLVQSAPVCIPWPTLWLEGDDRRTVFVARFDLMARDWGEDLAAESERRMAEFVQQGFLSVRQRPDLGARAMEFSLTPEGRTSLRGSPYGGERPSFCPSAGRRLVEITSMEWGRFDCGSLHVRFTHIADAWPAWAQSEDARARIESEWGPLGTMLDGSVTLARRWFRRDRLPTGVRNGALQSVCYDATRNEVVGDDLALNAP
jgi:hypothetical protein